MDDKTKKRIQKQIIDGSIYKKKRYQIWRHRVYKRDKHTCQMCGRTDRVLNAHHIKMKYYHPELLYRTSNGITLCKNCHFKIHKNKTDKKYISKFTKIADNNRRTYASNK